MALTPLLVIECMPRGRLLLESLKGTGWRLDEADPGCRTVHVARTISLFPMSLMLQLCDIAHHCDTPAGRYGAYIKAVSNHGYQVIFSGYTNAEEVSITCKFKVAEDIEKEI